jgi:cytochrome c-type biogenesis protein CcmH/NrfG
MRHLQEAAMEADTQHRLTELKAEIRRLETSLSQSPDDAFGYLELGCLFAEADQREAAIDAFRQSYAHRTGGIELPAAELPVVDEQLKEAFEVAVAQAPTRARGRTRELFEIAVQQEQQAETTPTGRLIAGVALLVIMGLAAFASTVTVPSASGYWPSAVAQQKLQDLPPTSGYWPPPNGGW